MHVGIYNLPVSNNPTGLIGLRVSLFFDGRGRIWWHHGPVEEYFPSTKQTTKAATGMISR